MLLLSSTRRGFRRAIMSMVVVSMTAIVAPAQPVEIRRLEEIQANVLPAPIVEGPHQHESLPDYYLAENNELAFRFKQAKEAFESGQPRPFRMVTLIAGDAGVGKTFMKKMVFSKHYPAEEVVRFDVKDLYQAWESNGKAIAKPDLFCRDVVLSSAPGMRDANWQGLYDHLLEKSASFYVIDSLDEVHPDDHVSLLKQVERFAFETDRDFVHVVVLGRGFAFRNYWEQTAGHFPSSRLNLYMLEPPSFQTTGDLLVSTWNYHRYAHKLRWKSNSESEVTLQDFQQWAAQDFARQGRFQDLEWTPVNGIDARTETVLKQLVTQHRYPQSALRNLAGNSFLREIIADRTREGVGCDETAFMHKYFEKWLVRDTKSCNRPSDANPEHKQLYLQLLEELAVKVVREDRLDSHGFFSLEDHETIKLEHQGELMEFTAHRILDRSGLKHLDPRTPGARRYRFEPIWLHQMLVDSYNDRTGGSKVRAIPIADRPVALERKAFLDGQPSQSDDDRR